MTMLTSEIMKYSKEDGLTYTSSFGDYSEEKGFQLNDTGKKYLRCYPNEFLKMLFTDETVWQVKPEPPKKMTMQEIRDALGYDFEITDYTRNDSSYKDLLHELFGA